MNAKQLSNLIENEEAMDTPEYPHCRRSMAKTEKKDLENLVLFTSLSRKSKKKIKKTEAVVIDEILQHNNPSLVGDEQAFSPTFKSSRHERGWIMSYLEPFFNQQMITDVIARVKGGKEANVYCCRAFPGLGTELVAAKIYRPRMFRSLRNDSLYREGRIVLDDQGKEVHNDKALHAVTKGSAFGKELSHTSWLGHEYLTLERLHAAGADVPKPYASSQNTILMQYLGEEYQSAATLNEVHLPNRSKAKFLFDRMIHNVDLMLANKCIHGDLSAYNILYWQGEVLIIDFPQAVNPKNNRSSFEIFKRDLTRLCQYFEDYEIKSNPFELARQLWKKHGYDAFMIDSNTDWNDHG